MMRQNLYTRGRRYFSVWILLLMLLATLDQNVEAMESFVDSGNYKILGNVPLNPQRIVSLDDLRITIPLLELGIIPIGSHGRVNMKGNPYARSGIVLTGKDFDNTDMVFLGSNPVDVEAIAVLRPDLILTLRNRPESITQLALIAPTVVLDGAADDPFENYKVIAKLTNTKEEAMALERRYKYQIEQFKLAFKPERFTVSVISGTSDGRIALQHPYGTLGIVLRDAGFKFPPIFERIPDRRGVNVSIESLQDLDADILIDTYRADRGEQPLTARNRLEAAFPKFCQFLSACRNNRYFIIPRGEAKAISYQGKSIMIGFLTGVLSTMPTAPKN